MKENRISAVCIQCLFFLHSTGETGPMGMKGAKGESRNGLPGSPGAPGITLFIFKWNCSIGVGIGLCLDIALFTVMRRTSAWVGK